MGESTSAIPKYVERSAQPYLAVRAHLPREALGTTAPRLLGELYAWLAAHSVAAVGKPFIRYLVVNYENTMVDIDVGVPTQTSAALGDDRVQRGVLPGGRYATVMHRGGYETLVSTTAELLAWARVHGVRWQVREADNVTTWACRVEHYVVGPPDEPNPERWQTEIAILLAPEAE